MARWCAQAVDRMVALPVPTLLGPGGMADMGPLSPGAEAGALSLQGVEHDPTWRILARHAALLDDVGLGTALHSMGRA